MSPPNDNNNDPGPPPWAGPPDHVEEREDGSIDVGKSAREEKADIALNADNQLERIEAKLDLLLDELDVDA